MENREICIIPCNGLDKSLGVIAREVALKIIEKKPEIKLVCPILLNSGDKNYEDMLKTSRILVLNGCMTRCATQLIEERDLKPFKQIMIPDKSKKFKIKPTKGLILDDENKELVFLITDDIIKSLEKSDEDEAFITRKFKLQDYFDITVDKYYFTVPKNGYFFNENDCWIKPEGKTALMGITDYLQNVASDILFVDLPEIGSEVEQFDDVGSFESSKTVLQLISPGSGRITAVNKNLEKHPEYLNQYPYENGWFAEIELFNFEEDRELLMDEPEYFDYMKNKIIKEKKHINQIKSEKIV